MHLFKSHESAGSKRGLALRGGTAVALTDLARRLYEGLTGEEKPGHMLVELTLLVLLLHIWAIVYLLHPDEPAIPAQPLVMQVSLIAAPPAQKPVAPPAPPMVKKPPAPKTPQKKPLPPKKPPVVRKPGDITSPDAIAAPKPTPASPQPTSAPAPASIPGPATAVKAKPETFTEANYRANYGFNPKPDYPRIARSRGWQGKVLLRVQVSAAGVSENIAVHQSSGHETLDESAVEAVRKWKFIPAKRGDKPVASSVIVPIQFTLND